MRTIGDADRRRLLSSGRAAKRLGITRNTLNSYLRDAREERAAGRDRPGLFPEPDYVDELTGFKFWLPETLDQWDRVDRLGQGHRSDLDPAAPT